MTLKALLRVSPQNLSVGVSLSAFLRQNVVLSGCKEMKKVHEVSALNHSSAGVVVFRKRPVINTKVFFDTRRTIAFDFGLRGNRRVAQFCFAPNSRNILINRGARSLNTAARNYISLHGQFLSTEAIIFASPAVRGPLVYFAGARSSTLATQ